MFTSFRYPTPKQVLIWLKRRKHIRPSVIAEELEVSRAFVSKYQQRAETRIKKLLNHAATINRIKLNHLSPRYGIAAGYCPATQTDTYITYSPTLGIQTWFTHTGDCASCAQRRDCEKMLHQLAKEWEITLSDDQPPTQMALQLFNTILRRLHWKEVKSP
jgi:hypothetical protein